MICSNCQTENREEANFCKNCGIKLHNSCNCWVKRIKYNCNYDKCPGFKLFILEKTDKCNKEENK